MTLRARLALVFAAVAVAGVVAASVAGYVVTRRELDSEIDGFLRRRAEEIVQGSRDSPRGRGDGDAAIAVEPDAVVQIVDARGVPTTSVGGSLPVDATEQRIATSGGQSVTREVAIDGERFRMRTVALRRDGGGAVQVARSLTETDAVLAGLQARLALVGVAVAMIAATAGWLFARRTTAPLRDLARGAAHVVATGDLGTSVATERRDEVGQLSRDVDAMLGVLATSREQQHRLVQDAGHELRTPLTALRTDVEVLRRSGDTDPGRRHAILANIETEVVELSDLVNELIGLATDAHDDEAVEPLDLAELVEAVVERFRRRSGRQVTLQAVPWSVVGRRHLLERAVTNLLGNAHKFSPAGAPVEVEVHDGMVLVRDHGPGIDPADRSHVFERFYRSETARSSPGSGLGLAIVQQVARRHGGTVHVGEAPGGGAEVGFRLPGAAT